MLMAWTVESPYGEWLYSIDHGQPYLELSNILVANLFQN